MRYNVDGEFVETNGSHGIPVVFKAEYDGDEMCDLRIEEVCDTMRHAEITLENLPKTEPEFGDRVVRWTGFITTP